jgi:hypothetical protein
LSYFEPLSEGIFPGDAAGIYLKEIDVIVPTTPPPFRLDIALASLDKLKSLNPKVLYYTHFGKASNATEKLQTYSQQLNLWAKIAAEGVQNKESLETITERIVERDSIVRRAREYLQVHPILSQTVLSESVLGFMDFAEKSKGIKGIHP